MSFAEFTDAIARGVTLTMSEGTALQALWHDGRVDWGRAHACVQNARRSSSNWVHAYLHRKEGDRENASN